MSEWRETSVEPVGGGQDGRVDLEAAARLLGVHYQTAYRWVRCGILPAVKVAGEYRLAPADVERLARTRCAPQPLSYTGRPRDWNRLRDQLHGALVAGEETGARRIFERLRLARVPLLEQCEELVAPAMRRIGDEWGLRNLAGARVRLAAGICERGLAWATGSVPPSIGALALTVTPDCDGHRLPSMMAGAVLRDGGWSVRDLAHLTTADVVALAGQLQARLIVVSVTLPDAAAVADEIRAVAVERLGVAVLVGGPGESLRTLHEDAQAVRAGVAGRGQRPPAA